MKTEKIVLADIVTDAGTQARFCLDEETVEDYADQMENGVEFPPIDVFHDGSAYYMGDGFHRYFASVKLDFLDIVANIHKGTSKDALWFAMGANRKNGRRMTRRDVCFAVEKALETWPLKTQQAIADHVGCSQGMVGYVKKQLINVDKLPEQPPTRVGKDGKERPTTYKKRQREETEAEEPDETPHLSRRELAKLPPCMGLQLAQLAILDLEQIADNDTERTEAFNLVRRWLDEHAE